MKSIVLALSALFLFVPGVRSEDDTLASSLQVSVLDYYPLSWVDNERKVNGLMVDFAKAIAQELGRPVEITALPYQRYLRDSESGASAFRLHLGRLSGLASEYRQYPRLACVAFSLISPRDNYIENIEALRGKRVIYSARGVFASRFAPGLLQGDNPIIPIVMEPGPHVARMLYRGRADAAAMGQLVFEATLNLPASVTRLPSNAAEFFGPPVPLLWTALSVSVHRSSPLYDDGEAFGAALQRLAGAGTLWRVMENYVSYDATRCDEVLPIPE